MRIDVKKLLQSETGTSTTYQVADEPLELPDIKLTSPVNGAIRLVAGEQNIYVGGEVTSTMQLECHRCLRAFERTATISLSGEFSESPTDDQWPIEKDSINLDPLIRQEFILSQPIKLICETDCPGLCEECGQRNEPGHQHAVTA